MPLSLKHPRFNRIFAEKSPAQPAARSSGVKPRGQGASNEARRIGASMSSYPPPPSTSDGTGQPQQPDNDSHQPLPQTHPQFTAEAAAAAVAAAHHGLQALQAAVAAPAPGPSPSPVTSHSQHASLADPSYLTGSDAGPSPGGGPNAKATRLRRACDMCSQRKVKVRLRRGSSVATSTDLSPCSATRPSRVDHVPNSASIAPSTGQ